MFDKFETDMQDLGTELINTVRAVMPGVKDGDPA
jgi:hypothetical protein